MRVLLADDAGGTDQHRRSEHLGRFPMLGRLRIFLLAAVAEAFLVSSLFDFDLATDLPASQNPVVYANTLAKITLIAFFLFVILVWPRRDTIVGTQDLTERNSWYRLSLLGNFGLFSALLFAKYVLSRTTGASIFELGLYSSLLLATGASLAFVAAPPTVWARLLKLTPVETAVAFASASVAVIASTLAQKTWDSLSSATLTLSHWFLTLYEPNVLFDARQRILGIGDFEVQVFGPCSGYEGVALIVAFLSIYTWTFRRDLRFPNVLLLFPVGVTVIWILNALRIAVLVSIGAHVSPDIAVQGFHSEAGWLSFLLVTLTIVAISRRVAFFAAPHVGHAARVAQGGAPSSPSPTLEFLAPFMALMVASIIASAFSPYDQWLYAMKVVAVGAVLWWFRGIYVPLVLGGSLISVAVGFAVGVAWIATDPDTGSQATLGLWLASMPAWLAGAWLALRAFGSVVLVPVAEELAFRGYLARALVSLKFESVGFGDFRMLAFVGSSAAFGLMHQRWVAACMAGAIYALLMYRSKSLSDPIAAHAASNAAIFGWAVAMQQWSLL